MILEISLKFITPDAENFIGEMAGICYDAKLNRDANIRRATKCSKDGHLATLRFAHAVFNVSGISRVCSHQFVRSKHLDFLQRSQRYCKEVDAQYTVPREMTYEQATFYETAIHQSQELYSKLLETGMKKEDARFILPEATQTELNVVGNLQAWMDFIKLRYDVHAQWEIREVARQINNLLHKECPNLFGYFP